MTSEISNNRQNMVIALLIGLLVPPGIGFGLKLWVTKDVADRRVSTAVLAAETAVCVGQFNSSPNAKKLLAEFKGLDYGAKSAFIEKGGWDKMPGEERARSAVTQECGSRLDALAQK